MDICIMKYVDDDEKRMNHELNKQLQSKQNELYLNLHPCNYK